MKKHPGTQRLLPLLLALLLPLFLPAQGPGRNNRGADAAKPAAVASDSTAKKEEKRGPKPYREVITKKAVSMNGMLSVHRLDDKFFFEIPDSIFGRDIIAITRIAKTPTGAGYGGEQANRQVVRFERGPSDKVFLRVVSFINVSPDSTQPIFQAVRNSNVDPIAAAFDIKALRKDTSVVIEVTDFFNNPNQAFSLTPFFQQQYNIKSLEKDRSYIESIRAFPINVEVRSVRTYSVNPPSPNQRSTPGQPSSTNLPGGLQAGVVTFELNTSMVLLPKVPMRKRFFDPRVGIFATRYTVYDDNSQRALPEVFAVRWRLEAKNSADAARQQRGELIEPAKPIVFYIDPATPLKWRSYLKQGVEDWQPAFEQAGWKNAILAKDWPENDTTMSLEDARFSVIRYFASDIENAYGPNVNDPRSGEIIESHIGWYHNVMKLLKQWYTTQTAAVDPRARKNQFDDELMGSLVRFVSSHEVGHTLGLRHNFGASNATPVEKLRDKDFIAANGHTSSIMDYARFNYVAQPEDGVADLFPRVGDYDRWAIEWNYKPIYGTADPKEDKKILNRWYLEKVSQNPRLRFLTESNPYDPRAQSEDLGDDAMKASEYGIKNLKQILPNAVSWTREEAEGFDMANELYNNVFSQYRRYIGHVTKWVGGIFETPKTYDQEGSVYEPAPREKQQEAMAFLDRHLFQTPQWLLDRQVLSLLTPEQGVRSLGQLQESTLNSLLSSARLQRLIETQSAFPQAYGLEDLYSDLQRSIWKEIYNNVPVSVHRRNLQKMHLEKLISMMEPVSEQGSSSPFSASPSINIQLTDVPSLSRATLKDLYQELLRKARAGGDRMSKAHFEDCAARIAKALDED